MGSRARPEPIPPLQRLSRFLLAVATENWGTKIMAFLLAVIVFVVTRDEVERTFPVPLRVVEDPDRVLLTQLPETVEVHLRGPWANVNRLGAADLGAATVDLREARPGPLELDPASIVMPQGVVLDHLDYDPVDLRFEAILERRLPVRAVIEGSVDPDYELEGTRVEPSYVLVRAAASELEKVEVLFTEPVDLAEASEDRSLTAKLAPVDAELDYVGVPADERPEVAVVIEVEARVDEIEIELATAEALREAVPKLAGVELPEHEHLTIRGPRSALREVEALDAPLVPEVSVEPAKRGAPIPLTLRFTWSEELDAAVAEQLSIEPPLVRLRVSPKGVVDPEAEAPASK